MGKCTDNQFGAHTMYVIRALAKYNVCNFCLFFYEFSQVIMNFRPIKFGIIKYIISHFRNLAYENENFGMLS